MKKILIIEDDKEIAELQRDYLELSHYQVELCHNGALGLQMAQNKHYDLIIIDIMLPLVDGYEICRTISQSIDIPIIIISAKCEKADKIMGLQLGATDYITKPFEPSEFVARVNAHIKRYERLVMGQAVNDDQIQIGLLRIEKKSHRVYLDEKEIFLPHKEYELLLLLMSNPDKVFSKNELLDHIWGINFVGDASTVTVHINRIRDKIETDSSKPKYIETIWGKGYRFNA